MAGGAEGDAAGGADGDAGRGVGGGAGDGAAGSVGGNGAAGTASGGEHKEVRVVRSGAQSKLEGGGADGGTRDRRECGAALSGAGVLGLGGRRC